MTTNSNSSRKTNPVLAIVIVLVIIAAVIGIWTITQKNDGIKSTKMVTYQVTATGGFAQIIYTDSIGHQTEAKIIATPFSKSLILPSGTKVYLTASNPSQTGTITCKIRIDNEDWKAETGTHPIDSIACGGIIP